MSRFMKTITGGGYRAACLMIAALLIELPAVGASAQTAGAPTFCFDIIATGKTVQPDGRILLNRCTGQTWLLSRIARRGGLLGYRWKLLVADDVEISKPLPRPEPQMSAPTRPSTGKCFSFQGRQFCE
jgi:hypothetical protein